MCRTSSNNTKPVVIYIVGFLNPDSYTQYNPNAIPPDVVVIPVFPSGVASIHDRVMEIFFEVKGGTVHYGHKHSRFHGHSEVGRTFDKGKFPEWCATRPVHLIGHSFGGLTALALLQYLKLGNMFLGFQTSADWVSSVTAINSPLNGCLRVYSLGSHESLSPIARWGSIGFFISLVSNLCEYFDSKQTNAIYNFKIGTITHCV